MDFQDTDSILAELETEQQSQETTDEPQESSKPETYEVNLSGKKENVSLSHLVDNFQKGYHYETKMSETKKLQQELEDKASKFENWEERYAKMEEVDKFYKENPDKLDYILKQYDTNRAEGMEDETAKKIATLEKTIEDLKGGYQAIEEERKANLEAKIQTEVYQSFNKMKTEHPYLNWEAKDGDSLKLEDYVLKYATDNNITNVETATLEYCKDQIFSHLKEQGKREAVDGIKEGSKQGVVSVAATPKQSSRPAPTDTSKSFEDLAKEAVAELEAGNY